MALNVGKEVSALKRMTVDQLRLKYAEVFKETTNGRNKQWLIKRIAWRMQANEEGDLSERARKRAAELANDADLRVTAPKPKPLRVVTSRVQSSGDARMSAPGTLLVRKYKGDTIQVQVRDDGFEYQGTRYKSLSAIARAVTGSHWSGHRFFGLQQRGDQ